MPTASAWIMAAVAMYAAILNIKKKSFSFVLWSLCSLYVFYLDIHSTNYLRAILDVMFFITSICGFIIWSRSEKKRKVLKSNQEVNEADAKI